MADTTKPTCLAEEWDVIRAERGEMPKSAAIQARRDFYAGATSGLLLLSRGVKTDALRAEALAFARTVGTSVESAS